MKVLMIDDRVPRASLGAGHPRANAVIHALLPACEAFAFYPLIFPNESTDVPRSELDSRVEVVHSRGFAGLAQTLAEFAARRYDVLWVSRPDNMRAVEATLKTLPGMRERFILVYDAEAFYAARTAQLNELRGTPDPHGAQRLEADEIALATRADMLVSVSAAEARLFERRTGNPTYVVGLPTSLHLTTPDFRSRRNFGFLGSVQCDSPNEDSLLWYAANVMRDVHGRTGATLQVAGIANSPFVAAYSGAGIELLGSLEETDTFLGSVRAFLAPTRFAAGLPQKLIDAASAGVPIVTTPLLAAALGWRHERELLVAADADRFADACCRIYADQTLWQQLREGAADAVRREFGAGIFVRQVEMVAEALAAAIVRRASAARPPLRIAFVNGYRIFPPVNGGHRRILDVYDRLGSDVEVRFFTLGDNPVDGGYFAIDSQRFEVRVPKSLDHVNAEQQANTQAACGTGQIYFAQLATRTPAFVQTLQSALARSDVAVVGAPYVQPVVRSAFTGPIVYHAHDVEALLQQDLVAQSPHAQTLLAAVKACERECVRDAALLVTMSDDDASLFADHYGLAPERALGFAPSVDLALQRTRTPRGASTRPRAAFIGSHWHPNVVAVEALLAIAAEVTEIDFVVIGGVAAAFADRALPNNVRFTGFVEAAVRDTILAEADLALNPCVAISGVNMKMTDYILAALPIVTTPAGARGMGVADGVHVRVAPLEAFPAAIRELTGDLKLADRLCSNAALHLERYFDARRNRKTLVTRLRQLQPAIAR